MDVSKKLSLYKPTDLDEVVDTINKISLNFQKIDDVYEESISDINMHLDEGETYALGVKFWNSLPYVGSKAGWINIREGVFAHKWEKEKEYDIGDLVMTQGNNGHIYQCVADGLSSITEPVFNISSATFSDDLTNHSTWTASYVYKLNDVVIPKTGDPTYHYRCVQAGTSFSMEPTWNNNIGTTITDGSAIWVVCKTVRWKEFGTSCDFVPFGDVHYFNTVKKVTRDIGDGAVKVFNIKHDLNTKDINVTIRYNTSPYYVNTSPDVKIIDDNNITITFTSTPTLKQYRVIITG